MATINKDQLEATLTVDANGMVAVRTHKISDLVGDKWAILYNAFMSDPEFQRGTNHPSIPGLQLDSIDVTGIGAAEAQIQCTYRRISGMKLNIDDSAPAQIQIGATLVEVTTQKGINGEQLFTLHTFTEKDSNGNYLFQAVNELGVLSNTIRQVGNVTVQIPVPNAICTRRESKSPLNKSLQYTGTLNSGRFLGLPAGAWLCKRIEGTSEDGGRSYNVAYEFQASATGDAQGWQPTFVAVYPDTKEPVNKPKEGFGIKTAFVYDYQNFDQLKLGIRL